MVRVSLVVLVGILVLANGSNSAAGEFSWSAATKAVADMTAATGQSTCSNALSKLTLTDDQKSKIAALQAATPKGQWTAAVADKFMSGLSKILTADQMATFKAASAAGMAKLTAISAAKEATGAAPATESK